MKILFPLQPVDRREFGARLRGMGFVAATDPQANDCTRQGIWRREADAVGLIAIGAAGVGVITIGGPDQAALAGALAAAYPSRSEGDVIAGARVPSGEAELPSRVRALFELAPLLMLETFAQEEAKAILREALREPEALLRWAAGRVISNRADRKSERALGEAAARYPDLQPFHAAMREACDRLEEGTLDDAETDDPNELLRRARQGTANGQWRRVARAMDALLAERPWIAEGLAYRGLAHAGLDEVPEALLLLGAAEEGLASDERLRREVDAGAPALPDAEEPPTTEQLTTVRAKIAELRARAADAGEGARRRAHAAVVRRLTDWERGSRSGAIYGGARALGGRLPELDGLLAFLQGRHDGDRALLERALRAAPDSPSVAFRVALATCEEDEPRGVEQLRALRAQLRVGGERSAQAALIEEIVAAGGDDRVPDDAAILRTLTHRAYEAKQWDRAAELADELTAVRPDSDTGWQIRANARIFALRHEEAVVACTEAIAALDRLLDHTDGDEDSIRLGEDPRPMMYFNRAAVLARLGRREDALASLRVAVRAKPKFADDARGDDYFESLFADPEFLAITARDPLALRTPEERDPAWIRALIVRARAVQQEGDLAAGRAQAEQATALAEPLGDAGLLAEALAVLGRMQAFGGDVDDALATSARAAETADAGGGCDPITRAMVHAQRGIVLQLAGQLDEAGASHRRAFEIRREALGDAHPLLVKSLVAIAGVALGAGRPAREIEESLTRGIDIANTYLAREPAKDSVWAELVDDLVSLLVRRAMVRSGGGAHDDALQALGLALDRTEEQQAASYVAAPGTLEAIRRIASDLISGAASPEQARAAVAMRGRAEAVAIPGSPEARRVRWLFRDVRDAFSDLRARGAVDTQLLSLLRDIFRGEEVAAELTSAYPILASLRSEVASAVARDSSVLATAAMALSLGEQAGKLDEALGYLEDLVTPG